MPALTPDQGNDLVKRGFDLLRDAADLTSGDSADYIRDGNPESPLQAIPLAAARQGCRRYADKGGSYPPLRAARAERACRPYLDSLNYNEGPKVDLPFRGGQCAAPYNITWSGTVFPFSDCSGAQAVGGTLIGVAGPILGVRAGFNGPTQPSCAPQNAYFYRSGPNGGSESILFGQGQGAVLNSFSVSRTGGQPDNCGNPPPDYIPPTLPPAPDPPGPLPFVRAPDIDIDIDVQIGPDGDLIVNVGTGPISIDPFGDPGDGDPGGGGGTAPVPPGFQGDPGAPTDAAGGDAADETDPTRNLVGVLVQTIETPPRANKIYNETETYTKGAYFVYFGGDAGLSLNPEGAITIEDQFFYAPEGSNRFRVVPNVGFAVRVTPFYNEEE